MPRQRSRGVSPCLLCKTEDNALVGKTRRRILGNMDQARPAVVSVYCYTQFFDLAKTCLLYVTRCCKTSQLHVKIFSFVYYVRKRGLQWGHSTVSDNTLDIQINTSLLVTIVMFSLNAKLLQWTILFTVHSCVAFL